VHRSAANSPASKFPSPASRESHTTGIHSAHPSSRSAPSPAACTQTGSPDQNTCIACTNAAQTRTSDTARPRPSPAAPSHIARTARPRASPADSPASGQARGPTSADRCCAPAPCAAPSSANLYPTIPGRDPDIHAVDISPREPPQAGKHCLAEPLPAQVSIPSTEYSRFGLATRMKS
jgi:hypothetical protein